MGTIQNSFNQLLGIAALGSKVVGQELGEHRANQIMLKKESEAIDKDLDVAIAETSKLETDIQNTSNEIEDIQKNGLPNYVGDKRLKEYRDAKNEYLNKKQNDLDQLTAQYAEKDAQIKEFANRIKDYREKELMEGAKFKKGLFGVKGAQEESERFNKELDNIVNTDIERANQRIDKINQKIEAKKALKYDPEKRKGGLNNE